MLTNLHVFVIYEQTEYKTTSVLLCRKIKTFLDSHRVESAQGCVQLSPPCDLFVFP